MRGINEPKDNEWAKGLAAQKNPNPEVSEPLPGSPEWPCCAFCESKYYQAHPLPTNLECQWPGHPNNIKCLTRHIPPITPLPTNTSAQCYCGCHGLRGVPHECEHCNGSGSDNGDAAKDARKELVKEHAPLAHALVNLEPKSEIEAILDNYPQKANYRIDFKHVPDGGMIEPKPKVSGLTKEQAAEAIQALIDKAVVAELKRLHRAHGNLIDNLTDEAIDERLDELEGGKNVS